ncbi:MFS transporter, UMF1 family [Catalinimonas alkaloidigena]|uniref:MFS transporter, UMF1 family n=1 Tax=Catalinimonas alkaloidigena TaxID=1075417 RepID=A0A1G8WIZ1_9BACT|nr:MFS transporter [Catalinimonas alkaloidigena]SDJ78033.1 MFS transporter, UMF1 family [Catalinimonas alkaloidigena]
MEKNVPRVTRAWCVYDWANSVFSLVIISTVFPIYYGALTKSPDGTDWVMFLGWKAKASALFSYTVSASFLLTALLSPFLTAIADYSGRKKRFMQAFCYLGATGCMVLFFFTSANELLLGLIAFLLAGVGYNGSLVFYNAYLPEIATEDQYDRLSARGFAMGYIGSVILLVANLVVILKPMWFGIAPDDTVTGPRISFLTTGLWWILFAQYTFYHLPNNPYHRRPQGSWIFNGFRELKNVWHAALPRRVLKQFLLAFFFYNMGVQTIMYLATLFGDKELHLAAEELIVTILLLQILAIAGAYGFAWLSDRIGNIATLSWAVVIWVVVCVAAYFITTAYQFYALASAVGLIMGGIQALSRATYAKLIPENTLDHASWFSFYDVVDKVSIVLGTFSYGLIDQLTGSMRNSALVIGLFFLVGLSVLLRIPRWKKTYA